jgi:hypothetical protein
MGAMGLGLGLAFGRSAGPIALSTITSLKIMGATPLLDATGDYSDATARIGVNANGWACEAILPYLAATTFDPEKITLTLSDPGYTSSGTTTRSRTVRGGKLLRRQWNNTGVSQVQRCDLDGTPNVAGSYYKVYFSLIGDLAELATAYTGTTISSATAASGYYGVASAGAIPSPVNNSTRAYPKPLSAWINRQHDICGAGGMYVELAVASHFAQFNQAVARVEFIGTDSSANTAATQTTSLPTLSTLVTKGQPPEVYAATIPMTALTTADLCFVNVKIYPWIGDSTAIYDSAVDGITPTGNFSISTNNPQTSLRFVNDKAATYATKHVAVQAGAGGGTVQNSYALAITTPYPTIRAALVALQAANAAAGLAHNDLGGGKVWLYNISGSAVAFDPGDTITSLTAGKCLMEVRAAPDNNAGVSVLRTTTSSVVSLTSWHVDMGNHSGQWRGGGVGYFCDGTHVAPSLLPNQEGTYGFLNTTFTNWCPEFAAATSDIISLIGCETSSGATVDATTRSRIIIGCNFLRVSFNDIPEANLSGRTSQDGKFIFNNKFLSVGFNSTLAQVGSATGPVLSWSRGIAFVQNVIERARTAATAPALSLNADSTTATSETYLFAGNTIVGNRVVRCYTDAVATAGVIKRMSSRFNLIDEDNRKTDYFATAVSCTGNWSVVNSVDFWDVVIEGSSSGGDTPAVGAWIGEYWGSNTNYNVLVANVPFVSDQSFRGTNAGNGDYQLSGGSNAAYATVPASKNFSRYDLAGNLRLTTALAASGAYERP